jgi:type IV pilus assembly protein PilW
MSTASNNQRGVTLVELMVSMTLGLIILGSAMQVFSANKQSFRFSKALARVQEDGRFAMQSMARDIRMASYVGCSSRQQLDVNTVATGAPPSVDLGTALFGYDNGAGWWSGVTPPQDHVGLDLTVCDAVGGGNATCQVSDIVQVMRGSETAAALAVDMASAGDTVRVRQTDFDDFEPPVAVAGAAPTAEDLVLITDCRRADLFRTTASGGVGTNQVLTPNAALQQAYQAGAIVTPVVAASYFVADDNSDEDGDGNPDPIPALYRMGVTDGGNAPVALPIAKGVEMMRVAYGVDTGGDEFADAYVTAGGVTDWSRVVSTRVSLLIKSKDDFVTDYPVPVTFVDGTVVNAGANADRRLRLVFSTTIGLRNRVP